MTDSSLNTNITAPALHAPQFARVLLDTGIAHLRTAVAQAHGLGRPHRGIGGTKAVGDGDGDPAANPTGQQLVLEKTIDFSPFASNAPLRYKDDCQPEPVAFRSPFAWDGRSALARLASTPSVPPDPRDMEECLRQLPRDSVEAESAHDQQLLEQWGSQRLGR